MTLGWKEGDREGYPSLHDHIVVCGIGKIGVSVCELLRGLHEPIIAVGRDDHRDWEDQVASLVTRLIREDARSERTLRDAGIDRARAVLIATEDDLKSLAIALEARRIAPQTPVVLRLYDRHLADRARREGLARTVLNVADLSAPAFVAAALGDDVLRAFEIEDVVVAISTTQVPPGAPPDLADFCASRGMLPLALRPAAASTEDRHAARMRVAAGDQVVVATTHPVDDLAAHPGASAALRASRWSPHTWVRQRAPVLSILGGLWHHASKPLRAGLLAFTTLCLVSVIVFREGLGLSWLDAVYFTTTVVTTVGFGDITLLHAPAAMKIFGCILMLSGAALFLICFSILTNYLVSQRFEQVFGRLRTTLSGHVVVVGLGNIGHLVVQRLHALREPVLGIGRDVGQQHSVELPVSIPVLMADAAQAQTLEQAGVQSARAVVAVTDDDLMNLRIAHLAEQLNPSVRTVVRLFDIALADKVGTQLLGIGQAISPSRVAAATFAAAALAPDVVHGFTLGGRLLMLRTVRVTDHPECAGLTVEEVRSAGGTMVLLRSDGETGPLVAAHGPERIGPGDRLVVIEEYSEADRRPAPCRVRTEAHASGAR
ncbi:MAG TPA: NAD-binding protein [Chthonomonadales bacterium]|nr:NAD-binding protein [Chthonomonadales bacterium]